MVIVWSSAFAFSRIAAPTCCHWASCAVMTFSTALAGVKVPICIPEATSLKPEKKFPKNPCESVRPGRHKRRILAGQDETRAHLDIARHDRLVVNPRHPRNLSVLARGRNH